MNDFCDKKAAPTVTSSMKHFTRIITLFIATTVFADSRLLVVNKDGNDLSIIDTATGQVTHTIPTGMGPHEVATTPNGQHAIVTDYGYGCGTMAGKTLTRIDLQTHESKTISLGKYRSPHGIVALQDNRRVVVSVECNDAVIVVDIHSGDITQAIPTKANVSHMVAVSPDEALAFATNIGSHSVSVLDLVKGKHIKNIPTGTGAEGLDVSPDGQQLWVSNREADTVTVIDLESLQVTKNIDVAGFPIRLKFTPSGSHALVSNATAANVAVINTETHQVIKAIAMSDQNTTKQTGNNTLRSGAVPIGLVISADGQTAYVANTNVNEIRQIDLRTNQVTRVLKAGARPDGLALVE